MPRDKVGVRGERRCKKQQKYLDYYCSSKLTAINELRALRGEERLMSQSQILESGVR